MMPLITLILSTLIIHASECETTHLAPDLYYGAVEKGLAMGPLVLTDRHLDKILASLEPIDPLEKEPPTVENGHLKEILERLVKNPQVLAMWPKTLKRLADLRRRRREVNKISVEAAEATRRVLAPHQPYHFSSPFTFAFTEPFTLPNGLPAIAHFSGKEKIVFVNPLTGVPFDSVDLPSVFKEANSGYLNWYTDSEGKIWLYVAYNIHETNEAGVYRIHWNGDRQFSRLDLQNLKAKFVILGLHSPMPGKELLRVKPESASWAGPHEIYDLAPGTPTRVNLESDFSPGKFLVQPNGEIVFPKHSGKIYRSNMGLYELRAYPSVMWATLNGRSLDLLLPDDFIGESDEDAFFQLDSDRAFYALLYKNEPTTNTRAIAIWDLGKPGKPMITIPYGHEAVVPGPIHWFRDTKGKPVLGFTLATFGATELQVVDPFTGEVRLTQDLPGRLKNWFEAGGETYFWAADGDKKFLYKMNYERKAP